MSKTVVSKRGAGEYGTTWESRVVKRVTHYYLIHDHFCGMGSLGGGMYRPFVYEIPSERLDEIVKLYETDESGMAEYFAQIILPTLECHGQRWNW